MLCFCRLSVAQDFTYQGVASCASSNCHGSVKGKEISNVLQNEYVTWKTHDSHSKAWNVLTNSESKIIGKHLGTAEPEKDKLCLSCHATIAKNAGEKFRVEDGVGCESCHGAASGWIKPHTANGTTHQDNLKNGLNDLVSSEAKSTSCLNCHLGNKNSEVTHRLIGAGHPRLTFELETFTEIMPRHWKYDADYTERKSANNASQNWLIGQITRAVGFLELFLNSAEKDLMPDFTFFNCYSCHHSLKEDQWKNRDYHGNPGKLNLNTSSLTLVSLALDKQELKNKINALQKAEGRETLIQTTREIITILTSLKSASCDTDKALARIKRYSTENPYPQYELAEQLLMAINVLSGKNSSEFKAAYKALEDEEGFKAEAFSEALKKQLR